ncbi:MAG: prepilin peptidase [Elusimicrobiales bacterium]
MIYFIVFTFGAIIGSFLNVVVYRSINEISIISPPSFCPFCRKPIRWYDNIPIVSYILLSGRCRDCGSKISLSYPAVEFISGFITLVSFIRWWDIDIWWFLGSCLISYLLLVASVIDIRVMMLSDLFSYLVAFLGVVFSFSNPMFSGSIYDRIISSFYGIICGAGLMYLLLFFGKMIYNKDAVGEGDVFLLGAIGSVVGSKGIFDVIFISSLIGSVYGISFILLKKASRHTPIPFGPFLSFACMVKMILIFNLIDVFFK